MQGHRKPPLSGAYLKPGEMFILDRPLLVTTVLGSCISVTFFNARKNLAAICHALFPSCRRRVYHNSVHDLLGVDCARCPEAFKYVDCALVMMVETFRRCGVAPEEIRVQLMGGARMIGEGTRVVQSVPVGQQNIQVAEKVLADQRLEVHLKDTGGLKGRKVVFNSQTGEVTIHQISRINIREFQSRFDAISRRLS